LSCIKARRQPLLVQYERTPRHWSSEPVELIYFIGGISSAAKILHCIQAFLSLRSSTPPLSKSHYARNRQVLPWRVTSISNYHSEP